MEHAAHHVDLSRMLASEVASVAADAALRHTLQGAYTVELGKMRGFYLDQLGRLRDGDAGWHLIARAAGDAAARHPGPPRQQGVDADASPLVTLYTQAARAKPQFDAWLQGVAARCGCDVVLCPRLKCPFRCIEKAALAEGDASTQLSRVCDVVRGMLTFASASAMADGLSLLLSDDSGFRVSRAKDRVAAQTAGGWADVVVNGHLADDPQQHHCEVQLCFARLLLLRSKLGGHEDYVMFRCAAELLVAAGYSPQEDLRLPELRRTRPRDAARLQALLQQRDQLKREMEQASRTNDFDLVARLSQELIRVEAEADSIAPRHGSPTAPAVGATSQPCVE